MSEIKLYRLVDGKATELEGSASDLEKPLQKLIEANLEQMLGIRLLASEYSTGKVHGGRIDTLGLDEDNCPVIVEYKRAVGESVINQGLYYLDWLLDHKGEFRLLAQERLGAEAAQAIEWKAPRVVCIAGAFTKFDGHAVRQMHHSIDLIRYRQFGADLLLLEQVHTAPQTGGSPAGKKPGKAEGDPTDAESQTAAGAVPAAATDKPVSWDKPYAEVVSGMAPALQDLLSSLEDYMFALGDDVQRKELKLYAAYKRLKNFATVVPQKSRLLLYLHLDPAAVRPLLTNARDVSQQGHWGTGDLEVALTTQEQLDAAKTLIVMAYEGRAPVPAAT
ncbi:DUF5655 domain-containing protein [Pseudaquabacterium pictum]|uniref:DUF5655 domain-containing protein n=1 Tax=Pseudaquabacterium pictum TaxID=2315236 RepID=A0A480AUX4_9BURK|nr:DUF5655 domain-containing protein [Rubrivivax pictus]GCL65153.1 hypothetical protein AQPW35_42340 [Rubrivivax pictus]